MATRLEIAELYVATFNRAADAAGLDYWVNDSGLTREQVAQSFFDQPETQATYGTAEVDADMIIKMYDNLFNRTVTENDQGVQYWLNSGISANDMIISLINGALGADKDTVDNKAAVSLAFADADALDGVDLNTAQAYSIMQDVTSDDATATAAINAINEAAGIVEGETISLTTGTDVLTGTSESDTFEAYLGQNSYVGGVSNTVSSADSLDGGAGVDTLSAQVVPEFFGATGDHQIDIQVRSSNVEIAEFEARDAGSNNVADTVVTVDAKDMTDLTHIGSKFSDGDLVIENLTTAQSKGDDRNTDEMTITMDHTDNFNSDNDASDLTVYFDEDYFITDKDTTESQAHYWLVNEDRYLAGADATGTRPLESIERNGVVFELDGVEYKITIPAADADGDGIPDESYFTCDTWEEFAAGIQTEIDRLVTEDNLTDLDALTVTVDYANADTTINDEGTVISMPAITIEDSAGRNIDPTGFLTPKDVTGEFDIYGRFDKDDSSQVDNPLAVDIDLHKVGREGEGGDLQVGGKELNSDNPAANTQDLDPECDVNGDPLTIHRDQGNGINEFNIDVLGNASKLSNVGSITSTNSALDKVYIETHADYVDGDSFASLTVRDGFEDNMTLVDADGLLGDLDLGEDTALINTNKITAKGGGDVTLYASNTAGGNTVETGSGDDVINVDDAGNLDVDTAGGSDVINLLTGTGTNTVDAGSGNDVVTMLNGANTTSVSVDLGTGNDVVNGNAASVTVDAGAGDDVSYVDNIGTIGTLAINTAGLMQAEAGANDTGYCFLYGRTLTVTFNGDQGVNNNQADSYDDGFEAVVTIGSNNSEYSYLTTEQDLIDAINTAISTSPLAEMVNKVDGDNNSIQYSLSETDWTDAEAAAIQDEYRACNGNSTLDTDDEYGALETVNNIVGTDSCIDNNNTVIASAGDDVAVLSTSTDSMDTIDINGSFNTLAVLNFTTNQDVLDFNTILDGMESPSGSNESLVRIATTFDTDVNDIEANSVNVVDFESGDNDSVTGVDTFASLTASNLTDLFDGMDSADYDNGTTNSVGTVVDLLNGDGSAIVMVHNDEDNDNGGNAGEYKVFEISFDGLAADLDIVDADIDLLGTIDFGAELGDADAALALNTFVASMARADTTEDGVVVDPDPDPDPEADETIDAAGTTDAADADVTMTVETAGVYTHTVENFAAGDVIEFGDLDLVNFDNSDFTDGLVTLTSAIDAANTVEIVISLEDATLDDQIWSMDDFNTVLAEGTIVEIA